MTDAELFAHYRETSAVEDLRFYLANATLTPKVRKRFIDALAEVKRLRSYGARRAVVDECRAFRQREADRRRPNTEKAFWEYQRLHPWQRDTPQLAASQGYDGCKLTLHQEENHAR